MTSPETPATAAAATMAAAPSQQGPRPPSVGLGTYKLGFIPASATGQNGVASVPDHDVEGVVRAAIDAGCRQIDCAAYYGNEARIGEALAASRVPREELYLVSKVWSAQIYQGKEAIAEQLAQTLKDLQTEYLDLYLLHWPVPGKFVEAYRVLEDLQRQGLVRSIGVSNCTIEDLEALAAAGTSVPVVNQLEVNPFLFRSKTIAYCQEKGIAVQAYRALGNGKHFAHPLLVRIADKHGKTVPQVMGRFLLDQDIIAIVKSSKPERVQENLTLEGFTLDEEDLAALSQLTTPAALEGFAKQYRDCIVRDTPLAALSASDAGVPETFTVE